jgi:hypothetical protein
MGLSGRELEKAWVPDLRRCDPGLCHGLQKPKAQFFRRIPEMGSAVAPWVRELPDRSAGAQLICRPKWARAESLPARNLLANLIPACSPIARSEPGWPGARCSW